MPQQWGKTSEVSMTVICTNLSARRSFSRPWPIKMVLALIKPSRSFCTSLSDLTELFPRFRSRAVTPENRVLQSIIVSSGRMMVSYTSLPSIPTTVTLQSCKPCVVKSISPSIPQTPQFPSEGWARFRGTRVLANPSKSLCWPEISYKIPRQT